MFLFFYFLCQDKGIKILTSQYNFDQIFEYKQHEDITNEGWATILLDKWNAEFARRREEKLKRISKFDFIFKLFALLLLNLRKSFVFLVIKAIVANVNIYYMQPGPYLGMCSCTSQQNFEDEKYSYNAKK